MDKEFLSLEVPLFFGRYLIHRGIINEQELAEAIKVQMELNACYICTVLELELISIEDLIRCRRYQREQAVSFETALSALNLLTSEEFHKLDEVVGKNHTRIGDILVKQGRLTQEELDQVLQEHQENGFFA
ncbi:MAG: hypothetical protein JW736_04865 [Deltaproteobacteria bacterium]|nr:hypothetical protein [Deltaproteobacteria bacterium]